MCFLVFLGVVGWFLLSPGPVERPNSCVANYYADGMESVEPWRRFGWWWRWWRMRGCHVSFSENVVFSFFVVLLLYLYIYIYVIYTCLICLLGGCFFLRKMVHWSKWLICMCACILLHTWSLMFNCIYSYNFYTCSMFLFSTCSGFKRLESLSAKWNLKEKFHRWCHSGRCCFRISDLIH